MSRLEASIRTPLSFRRNISDGTAELDNPAETVELTFDGRVFVWHAIADNTHPHWGSIPLGPTVTSALDKGDVVDADLVAEVATELERLLSALTYLYDVPAEVVSYGTSWENDLLVPPYTATPKEPGWARKVPFDRIMLRRDSEGLLKALGWYREGRNAGSPYYRFLAHWNALEAVFYGPQSRDGRAEFLNRITPTLAGAWTDYPLPSNPSEHFDEASRDAIAHVFRGEGGTRPLIDPDADADRQRLDWESRFLQLLVPHAIREVFGEPIAVQTD